MLRVEVLTPAAVSIAPPLCAALEGLPFVLAGGTGLALQLGHRVSVDFDWFCQPAHFPSGLSARITKTGKPMTVIQETTHIFECLLDDVKCSFFAYQPRLRSSGFRFHERSIAAVEDIAVMKLVAISQRGAKKDFFDLYEILKGYDFRAIARHAKEMLSETPVNPVHVAKSLSYFDDAERDPEPLLLISDSWDAVKDWFARKVREHTDILLEELRLA